MCRNCLELHDKQIVEAKHCVTRLWGLIKLYIPHLYIILIKRKNFPKVNGSCFLYYVILLYPWNSLQDLLKFDLDKEI